MSQGNKNTRTERNHSKSEGWIETTLDKVCHKVTDGSHQSPKAYEGGIPMLSVKDMNEYGFDIANSKTISKEDYIILKNQGCKPEVNDILIAKDGSVLKHIFRVKEEIKAVLLSSIAIVKPKIELINPDYLVYILLNPSFKKYILNNFLSGSGVPRIVLKDFKKIIFKLPPLQEQKAIANVLTAFDDKIENLRAQNDTLEQTAQIIFTEWFGKYQLEDELPEGWRVGKISEISILRSGYAFKSKDFIEQSNFKALKIKDLKGNGVVSVSDVSSVDEASTRTKRVEYFRLMQGDIVLAMSGNTTGKIGIVPPHTDNIYLNQRVGKFFLKEEKFISYLYYFLMAGNFEEKILAMGYGSAQPNINPTQIENIDIIIPDNEGLNKFLNISAPVYDKVLANLSQMQILTQTRDTLLPKLMSGQLRVSESKK